MEGAYAGREEGKGPLISLQERVIIFGASQKLGGG